MTRRELEKIEEEAKYTAVLNEASEMNLMLNTRLTEACSNERRLLRKLGKYVRPQGVQENSLLHPLTYESTTAEPISPEPNHLSANRSRIVQRLRDLPPADRRAESNEQTYDKICVLLNQMLSAGQDIRATKDAMWSEAILSKFHRDIVEPVLVKMREQDDTTVENIMQMIETEISAKSYIQSRTQLNEPNKRASESRYSRIQKCAICDKDNHFAWQCTTPLTVTEKRQINS
ncbi:hypothetical protein COOONC_03970 [Cooperia oncophora]